jgi:hypothetical protein
MGPLFPDNVLEEKASLARRVEAVFAVRSSIIGMAKTRGGVAIGRCGIANGDRPFKSVTNQRDKGFIVGKRYPGLDGHRALECVISVDEGATIGYGACKGNFGCTNKSEIFIRIVILP